MATAIRPRGAAGIGGSGLRCAVVALSSRTETIEMPGGSRMDAYVVLPEPGSGPGVLVLMEIFGVGPYIRRACERLAELGYVALAPDLYRRLEPGLELAHDDDGMQQAMAAAQRLDAPGAIEDAVVALGALRALPETTGRTGVLGFCLGGRLAYGVAAAADPDAAVAYYGSGIADALGQAGEIECPVLFHFGGEDQFIARTDAERVGAAAAERDDWEFAIQEDGGHAFDNHESARFHRPAAAARAWDLTRDFLARRVG
ncbi:MAG: carboxymethylenebutenolidase [Thermoleophilaceae bacterium]|nr:carboxymethylenebutenolidase [Thermoleophilaceae bacterium]